MMFPTDYSIDPATLAHEVESRGFDSLWFPEHSHIPTARTSPYPGGGNLPRMYVHTYDPFVGLTAAAAATTTLKVGTGICLVIQRDTIHTAKEVACLDRLSGGRFLFGVGAGWNREEMADHGTNPKTRMRLLAEQIHAMKALWTQEEAEFHGEFVAFSRSWAWPKPLTEPHPPVLVGGMGPGVEDRILDFGDEWMPQRVGPDNIDEFAERAEKLAAIRAESPYAAVGGNLVVVGRHADCSRILRDPRLSSERNRSVASPSRSPSSPRAMSCRISSCISPPAGSLM